MTRFQALAQVATLQAAFPAGNAGDETAQLYATLFEPYDAAQVDRAVRNMIHTRKDAFLPTWAEIQEAVIAERPRPKALPEPAGVEPTLEQQRVIGELMERGAARSGELQYGVRILRAAVRRRYQRDQQQESA